MPSTQRFDITRVKLKHYRSIGECDVKLEPLTILVGPNGSGKSNFVDSLRLVSQALDENLDNALRERGGAAEVRRRSNGHPTHFTVDLTFESADYSGTYMFQIGASQGGEYRVARESCRVRPAGAMVDGDHWYEVRDGKVIDSSYDTAMPPASEDRLYLVNAAALPHFRSVFDGLSDVNVYNLNPGVMREPQRPDAGDLLRRDGANIASVLEHLQRNDPATKAKIEDYLQLVVPGTTGASRVSYGAYESIAFRQKVAGRKDTWTFPATSMSDGTLRALGVLVALFSRGNHGYSPIGIEEPETALHPAAAGLLLEALQTASEDRQVIATSHSPELLDSADLKPHNILAVRADGGVTTIGEVDEVTAKSIEDKEFTAGELLRVDQLQPNQVFSQPGLFA